MKKHCGKMAFPCCGNCEEKKVVSHNLVRNQFELNITATKTEAHAKYYETNLTLQICNFEPVELDNNC